MRLLLIFLLCGTSIQAGMTIEGKLENGTLGGEGTADLVQLWMREGGMQPVGSLENVTGSFSFEYDGTFTPGMLLVQAHKGAVSYSTTIAEADKPITIKVYDGADDVAINARLGSLALYAYEGSLDIGLFYNLDNLSSPPQTLLAGGETFSFPISPGYKAIEANTVRGRMPLKQNLAVTDGRASLNYALKPGRTQLMVRLSHDYNAAGENRYTIPLLEDQEFVHVLALPQSLEVEAEGLAFVSIDQQNGAALYEYARPAGGGAIEVTVSGEPAAERGEQHNHGEEAGGDVQIQARPNMLSTYRWYVVSLVLALLAMLSWFGLRT